MPFNVRWERVYLDYVNEKNIKSFLFVDSVGFDSISMLRFDFLWHSGSTGISACKRWIQRVVSFWKCAFELLLLKASTVVL